MLYSGEHDLGIYENWGSMALVLVWRGSSQGRGIETSGFLARKTYRKGKGRAWCFELRSHLESARIIKDQEKESLEFKLPVNVSDHLSHSDSVTDGVTMCVPLGYLIFNRIYLEISCFKVKDRAANVKGFIHW